MRKIMSVLILNVVIVASQAASVVTNSGFELPATVGIQAVTAAELGWTALAATNVPFEGGVIASGFGGSGVALISPEGAQHAYFNVKNIAAGTAPDIISLNQTLGNSQIGETYSLDFLYAHAHATYKNAVAITVFIDGAARLFASSDINVANMTWTSATSAAGAAANPTLGYFAQYTATTESPIIVYLRLTNRRNGDAKSYVDAINLYQVVKPVTNYYVSTTGNDVTGEGSISNPWATFTKAKASVRSHLQAGLNEDICVYFRGGTYYLDQTLNFTSEDSGTVDYKIVYSSYPGEYAVISGGAKLTGWVQETGGKWSVTIPQVSSGQWWFRQLWMNGERCIRSRWPNAGQLEWISAVSTDLKDLTFYSGSYPGTNFTQSQTEIVLYHQWEVGKSLVDSRLSGSVIRTQLVAGAVFPLPHDYCQPKKWDMAHLEHNLDYIDAATEWYLDRATGKLTFLAPTGVNPNEREMVAPKLGRLIKVEGTLAAPVRNIRFTGLGFSHTYMPLPDIGYRGLQAGFFAVEGYVGPQYILPFAVEMKYAESFMFDRCNVVNMGTGGIAAGMGTKYITIQNSTFDDLGCIGIMTGWRGSDDWSIQNCGDNLFFSDWSVSDYRPQYCTVRNNFIHDIGVEYPGSVALMDAFTFNTTIANNYINNTPYSGIHLAFSSQAVTSSYQTPMVRNNHISEVMRVMNDGGGLYQFGISNGGIIKDNIIHDVLEGPKGDFMSGSNRGFYFDIGSTSTLQHNAAWNVTSEQYLHISSRSGVITDTGDNLWAPDPLPVDMIAAAGPLPEVYEFEAVISADCKNVIFSGCSQAWAEIAYAKCVETGQSIEHYITMHPNGEFTASVPVKLLQSGINTFQIQVYTPDNKYSPVADRQIRIVKELFCDNKVDFNDFAILANDWPIQGNAQRNGLVGYWNFDETGGTVAIDSSGNGNNAAISGAVRVPGIGSGALEFTGAGMVELPASVFASVSGQITIAFWHKGGVNQPSAESIFGAKDASNYRVLGIHLPWSDESVIWDARRTGSAYDRTAKAASSYEYMQKWNHWVFTKNAGAGSMKIYLNGQIWHSASGNTRSMSGISSASIGAYAGGGMAYNGIVDEFRVYNRELSSQEAADLYADGELYLNSPLGDLTGDHSVSFEDLAEITDYWLESRN